MFLIMLLKWLVERDIQVKNNNLNIFILAGGKSSRFGENKAFQKIYKKTFLEYLKSKFEKFGKVYFCFKVKRYPKIFKNSFLEKAKVYAPIFGIYESLKKSDARLNLFLAVDMPLISENLIKKLLSQKRSSCFLVDGKIQPFPILLEKTYFLHIEYFLKKNIYKLKYIFENLNIQKLPLKEIYYNNYLRNFNYKKDIIFLY
ncbi:MAG TPA: molybdenum cofactor guanylyltransferase [Desulfurobacteriaceae bacterium]|nr:molybdenum cofactor guanylyltransferase [Desulfurobacteriaceae bacterium]